MNPSNPKTELRIGIAGLGTVGGGVYQNLLDHKALLEARSGCKLTIAAIADKQTTYAQNMPPHCRWLDDAHQLYHDDDIDVVVELIGGASGIAETLVTESLQRGKHVVTANKALLALKGEKLFALAEKNQCHLAFEAAVAGGIPVIKALREGMMVNHIKRITGILNGTCNYILTSMAEKKKTFNEALKQAQAKGFAEADPTMDIGGHDAAHKLILLSAIAWGKDGWNSDIPISGVETIGQADIHHASQLGFCIRHLADAALFEDSLHSHVGATLIPLSHPLAHVRGVTNAVLLESSPLGPLLLEGHGAGRDATSSAVIADITDIARNAKLLPMVSVSHRLNLEKDPSIRPFYLRLEVEDRAGVLAHIAEQCATLDISYKNVFQEGHGNKAQLVMVTHPVKSDGMERLKKQLQQNKQIIAEPQILPIFEDDITT